LSRSKVAKFTSDPSSLHSRESVLSHISKSAGDTNDATSDASSQYVISDAASAFEFVLQPQFAEEDKIDIPNDFALEHATEVILNQLEQASIPADDDRKPSLTQDLNSQVRPQEQSKLVLEHDSSGHGLFTPSFQLPEEVSSLLREGFRDNPLSVSLSKPPISHITMLEDKITWHGHWREGWESRWGSIEPQIENIKRDSEPFLPFCGINPTNFTVTLFHKGMWNKLYLITSKEERTGAVTKRIF
jgi:hypothetical protein